MVGKLTIWLVIKWMSRDVSPRKRNEGSLNNKIYSIFER